MHYLPTTLLLLALSHLTTSAPVDLVSCTPVRLTPILGPSYSTSQSIGTYCSSLLLSHLSNPPTHPLVPAPESTLSFPEVSVLRACECVLATFQKKAAMAAAAQGGESLLGGVGVDESGEAFMPYGRGAVPVPVGSELKGFGARDNLYIRGGLVDGARSRSG